MIITTIRRSYSKTINTRNYGDPKENWIKIEADATAELERNDNELNASENLFLFVKDQVISQMQTIISHIQSPSSASQLTAREAMINPPKL